MSRSVFIFRFLFFIAATLCGLPRGMAAGRSASEQFAAGRSASERFAVGQSVAGPLEERPAADRAAQIVAGLADAFRGMKGYSVAFSVEAGGQTIAGRYAVEGDDYFLSFGDAEVFGDGDLRYEVDNRRREITIDRVDTLSRNILSNPVRAFDFLGSDYTAELLWERDGRAALRLTPVGQAQATIRHIDAVVSTSSMRPLSLTYNYDGELIAVAVDRIEPLAAPLRRFDRKAYAGYESIDFR